MSKRIEWRHNNGWEPMLIVDDETDKVITYFDGQEADALRNMLVGLGDLDDWQGAEPEDATDPGSYGELVMARGADGTVTHLDAELFRQRLAFFFRGN